MTDEERPEDDAQAGEAGHGTDWDTNNETEAYATGQAPGAPLPGFRSVGLDTPLAGGASGFEPAPTRETQRYGLPAAAVPQPVARQLRSTLTELDDVLPPGSSAWDLPANQTQQYGGPSPEAAGGAPVPAGGGWAESGNRTQIYGTGPQAQQPPPPAPGESPTTDVWGDASNRTQRYAPGAVSTATPAGGAPIPGGGGWDTENNRTQQYTAPVPAPGGALAPPREESHDPWGSPQNNTAFYAHGLQVSGLPPPNVTEGTEPNPPAPRSGTEPYGQPISSESQEAADESGPRPTSLEEAARYAADEIRSHRPAPRGDLPAFAEIDDLEDELETLDTETSPADGPMPEQSWIPRGTVPTVGGPADSGAWQMSPPAGVNKADTSGPHIPKVQDPGSFALEPPTTKPGE